MEGNRWATPELMEVPFWRDGMTVDEYEIERIYYYNHIEDVKAGSYSPLWKQKSVLD